MLTETDRREIFGDVNAQLAEFTALIKDLVSLARDDQVAAAPEPIDLRDVITAALERARRRAPKGVEFDVELSPLYVMGESDDLERAITNLLDNAVKWSPPDGTVRIYLEGDRLRVADQGPGIADADLPHIFDRFYRADTARNTPGTGLGLSIVAQTVATPRRLDHRRAIGPGRGRVHRAAPGRHDPRGPGRADRADLLTRPSSRTRV